MRILPKSISFLPHYVGITINANLKVNIALPAVNLKQLLNEPALVFSYENTKVLCVADVHVGYEAALKQAGFRVPSQTEKLVEKIYNLVKRLNAKKLIILGDVKHEMAPSKFTLQECSSFLNQVSSFIDVEIVKGNHDVGIEKILPKNATLHDSKGIFIAECGISLLHGHAWPKPELLKAKQMIIAHNHPVIEIRDGSGAKWLKPVWMETQLDRMKLLSYISKKTPPVNDSINDGVINLLVMPAFNPLLGGVPLNVNNELLGPLLSRRLVDPDQISLTLLDATYIGKLSYLQRIF